MIRKVTRHPIVQRLRYKLGLTPQCVWGYPVSHGCKHEADRRTAVRNGDPALFWCTRHYENQTGEDYAEDHSV